MCFVSLVFLGWARIKHIGSWCDINLVLAFENAETLSFLRGWPCSRSYLGRLHSRAVETAPDLNSSLRWTQCGFCLFGDCFGHSVCLNHVSQLIQIVQMHFFAIWRREFFARVSVGFRCGCFKWNWANTVCYFALSLTTDVTSKTCSLCRLKAVPFSLCLC